MFPDLGKYAVTVTSAYAVTLTLMGLLVLVSVLRARKTKRQLDALEANRKR